MITAAFAAESIGRWWDLVGQERDPQAQHLYITADGGGSNGWRNRLWKVSLQALANRTHLTIHVSHFPPERASGTKLSTDFFRLSASTGVVEFYAHWKP